MRWLTAPAMLMPALGNIGINYIAPLVIAKLVGRIADDTGSGAVSVSVSAPRSRTSWDSAPSCCSPRRRGASACTV